MSEIYRELVGLADEYQVPGPWPFLPADAAVRSLPEDVAPLIAGLRERFPDIALGAAGVLTSAATGELRLSESLRAAPRIFLAVQPAAETTPSDILGPGGSLAGSIIPCLAAAADAYTAACLPQWRNQLFLTFDIREAAILRSLRLPVSVASGLERLDGESLASILGPPRCLPPGLSACRTAAEGAPHEILRGVDKLVLVGWDVQTLSRRRPPGADDVAALLCDATEFFGFNTARFAVWRPGPADMQRIKSAIRLRDANLVRHAIRESLHGSLFAVEDFARDARRVPAREELRQARAALCNEFEREQRLRCSSPYIPRLLERYERAFRRAFVERLVREGTADADPVNGAVLRVAAELIQELHNRSPLIVGCGEHAQRTRLPWTVPQDAEALKSQLALVDRLLKIWATQRG